MKRVLFAIALAAVAIAVLPAAASAASASAGVRGVVVSRSHGTLLVATRTGSVVAVKGHAAIGSRVVGRQVVGRATHARIHGVVVTTKGSTMFVASNRHLLAIRTGRHLADNGGTSGTAPGTVVTTTVGLQNGQLNEDQQTEDGQDQSATIPVSATVSAVGPGTVTLTVNGVSVTLELPAGLTLPSSIVGQTVTINVSLSSQGDDSQGDDDSQGGDGGGGVSGGGD
jgi:hypothetical protein